MLVVSDWKSVIRAGGKMRKASFLYLLMASVLATAPARAQSALEDQIEALREDVIVLQRKAYRDKEAGVSAGSAQDVIVRLGEMDENYQTHILEVDARARMELMKEYKSGDHVKWKPDDVIDDYYMLFPEAAQSEEEPVVNPSQDDNQTINEMRA